MISAKRNLSLEEKLNIGENATREAWTDLVKSHDIVGRVSTPHCHTIHEELGMMELRGEGGIK